MDRTCGQAVIGSSRGFTLIELLVLMAMVAILAGLLRLQWNIRPSNLDIRSAVPL